MTAPELDLDLTPLGDRAFLARFADEATAAGWAAAARERLGARPGLGDIVLAYRSAAVFAEPDLLDLAALEAELRGLTPVPGEPGLVGLTHELPVLYDGPDLAGVATRLGLAEADVVALHSGAEYAVFAVGFLPGFPYAGYLPDALRGLGRRDSPRARVPAGSVAIAGRQTGVYPQDSPGGWHLLGRTPLAIADPGTGWFPIQAGDRLRFRPISADEFVARRGEPLQRPGPDPDAVPISTGGGSHA